MKKAVVILPDGFEEVEALTPVDVLRRANISVLTVSITKQKEVIGAHNIQVIADQLFDETDFSDFDAIILPGGMPGTTNLNNHEPLKSVLKKMAHDKKLVTAICAAPMVLGECGLLDGREATCYPGFESHLKSATIVKSSVVKDGIFITANGIGSAMSFALTLVENLAGQEMAINLKSKMLIS